jgi:hypothetical protein
VEGGKPESLEKNPRNKGENQQQTQLNNMTQGPGIMDTCSSDLNKHTFFNTTLWQSAGRKSLKHGREPTTNFN